MNSSKKIIFRLFLLLLPLFTQAQHDTIHLSDGTFMVGEIKSLERGVLTIETSFSDSDFKVESDKIETINSSQHFIIILKNSEQYEGTINATDSNYVEIIFSDSSGVIIKIERIVELRTFDERIKDRFSAYIDFGLDLTKANNLRQYSLRGGGSYRAKRWYLSINLNSLKSSQDNIAPTERNDGNLGIDFIMTKNWFLQSKYSWLQNNEQNLKLRTITSGGLGKFLFKNSHFFWTISSGAAWVNESYLEVEGSKEPDKESGEAYFSTELNLFNMGDLGLLTNLSVYPSLTEKDRIRLDWKFDIKYDLPLDFYIGLGTTVNYDNSPAAATSELDYIFQTVAGWKL